jgi:predicted enzyme related to lactoylglutathione lyase
MSAAPRFGFAVAYVDDIGAAKRFYVEELGLTVQREAPNFVQFDHFALASDESMDGKRSLELYWLIDDVEGAVKRFQAKDLVCMPLRTLPFGKVLGVRDPSGQPRYLLELSRDRPSKPV